MRLPWLPAFDEWKAFFDIFNQQVQQIYLSRDDIIASKLPFEQVFSLYTDTISRVLQLVANLSTSDMLVNQNSQILAYHQLLMAKEFAGQERALGAYVIFTHPVLTIDRYDRFKEVIHRQTASFKLMGQLVQPSYRADVERLQNHPFSLQLQELREEVKHKINLESSFSVTQEGWVSLCTQRINLFQEFEKKVFSDLIDTAKQQSLVDDRRQWLNIVLALIVLSFVIYFWFFVIRKRLIQPINAVTEQLVSIIGFAHYHQRITGDFRGEFAVMRDHINEALSRLEKSVDSLEQDKQLAEQLSHAKSNFVHHITHELRTPLNAILGFTQLLQMDQENPVKGDPLDQIGIAARHLLTLINQVLDMGKIESGNIEIEHIPFVLSDVIELVMSITESTARHKGLSLERSLSTDLPVHVKGDPTRLRQVLINLIGNAIKFTKKGYVRLSVQIAEDQKSIQFEVADSGIGMSEEAQQRLFKPFSQADQSITRQFGGTGLGLSLSKQLIELMDGNISFSSQEGIGTRFWFTLPLITVSSEDQKVAVRVIQQEIPQGKVVLLAEDNRVNQMVATKLLSKLGVEVVVAEHGEEALRLLAERSFDLLLLDIQMPIKDGYETIMDIREKEKETGQHLCVIGLSANGLKEDADRAVASGMDDYMSKPIEFEMLREKMSGWLSRSEDGAT